MEKYERFKDVPHFDLVKENTKINISSIFIFKGGCSELFPFLAACTAYNCEVYFQNEDITVKPTKNMNTQTTLMLYMSLIENPKVIKDYINYLTKVYLNRTEG